MTELKKNEKSPIDKSLKNGINDMTEIKEFIPRRFTKTELARRYNLTVDGLRKRMRKKAGLMPELHAIGYEKNQKDFTKEQVIIIIKYLGEPF